MGYQRRSHGEYGRTYLKRSIMMFDFTCVNLAILVLFGLVASEADPQLVYQQPSYIYPGGHPVYKMAGIPYAYPVYNPVAAPRAGSSIASGPETGEIVNDGLNCNYCAQVWTLGRFLKKAGNKKEKKRYQGKK